MTPRSVLMMSLTDRDLSAEAIVNASNADVGLGSGVRGAIRVTFCGDGSQQLVRRTRADEFDEPLQPDDCLVTSHVGDLVLGMATLSLRLMLDRM